MHSNRHILLLVNSYSGKGKGLRILMQLADILRSRQIQFSIHRDDWPEDISAFSEVWLMGGDGTVNYFINKYPHTTVPLAIFRGGTGNDLAWKLYGDISVEEQAELVLSSVPKKIDLGCCNKKLYANSLGIGFDGEVLRGMHTVRWLGGHLGYLFVVLKKLLSFREFNFKIDAGNKTFSKKYLLVLINNSSRTGGGFMVSPKASLTDGQLDMVLCEKLSLWRRMRYLPVIEKGKHSELPFISYSHETVVKVNCDCELFAQIDGELISAASFEVKVLPGALTVKY